jgi:hypothetical protein
MKFIRHTFALFNKSKSTDGLFGNMTENRWPMFPHWYAYQGNLGEVVYNDQYFFAWKDGCLIGTSKRLEEAVQALVWSERLKTSESK